MSTPREKSSAYASARQRNIERNKRVLQKLGVTVAAGSSTAGAAPRSQARRAAKRRRPAQPSAVGSAAATRRSRRIASKPHVNYEVPRPTPTPTHHPHTHPVTCVSRAQGDGEAAARVKAEADSSVSALEQSLADAAALLSKSHAAETQSRRTKRARKAPRPAKPVDPRSCRALPCDVQGLTTQRLGRTVPPLRGAAMKEAAMVASCGLPGVYPRFSKMSGIQQWANAVALFVNVGGDNYTCVLA